MGGPTLGLVKGLTTPHSKRPTCDEMLHRASDLDEFFGTTEATGNGRAIWNVRSLYSSYSLKSVSRESTKYRLDLVGVQEVRWDKGGTEPADDYAFLYGNGNSDRRLGMGFFVHKGIRSPVKRVEFDNDGMPYFILRRHWCDIIILNVHAPTGNKCDGKMDSFYEELERAIDQAPKYHMKILLGDFSAKVGREDIFKPKLGNENLYDTGVKEGTFPHKKF
jgi:hypothetical protein